MDFIECCSPLKRWVIFNRPSGAEASGKQRSRGTAENSPVFQHRTQKLEFPSMVTRTCEILFLDLLFYEAIAFLAR